MKRSTSSSGSSNFFPPLPTVDLGATGDTIRLEELSSASDSGDANGVDLVPRTKRQDKQSFVQKLKSRVAEPEASKGSRKKAETTQAAQKHLQRAIVACCDGKNKAFLSELSKMASIIDKAVERSLAKAEDAAPTDGVVKLSVKQSYEAAIRPEVAKKSLHDLEVLNSNLKAMGRKNLSSQEQYAALRLHKVILERIDALDLKEKAPKAKAKANAATTTTTTTTTLVDALKEEAPKPKKVANPSPTKPSHQPDSGKVTRDASTSSKPELADLKKLTSQQIYKLPFEELHPLKEAIKRYLSHSGLNEVVGKHLESLSWSIGIAELGVASQLMGPYGHLEGFDIKKMTSQQVDALHQALSKLAYVPDVLLHVQRSVQKRMDDHV